MAPSTNGFETIILSGVRPIISLARLPTDIILLSKIEIATTDGSLIIIPFLGIKTTVLVVPKSIPIFFAIFIFFLCLLRFFLSALQFFRSLCLFDKYY